METKDDISYGVVPLFKEGHEWKVLLIYQTSYRGDSFWIFPKGHPEHEESPKEAALRELVEETGLVNVTLHDIPIKTIGYTFLHEGIRINKQVEYFIGECADQMTAITQPEEVSELRWCTFKEAYDLLLHQNSKEVLKQVEDFLYKQT